MEIVANQFMFNGIIKDTFGEMVQIDTYTLLDECVIKKLEFIQRQVYSFMK